MVDSKHSIIGCHYDGYGVAVTVAESSNEGDYHVLKEWYQLSPAVPLRVANECDEIFYYEALKPDRKIEIFINDSALLQQSLLKMPSITRNSIKVASIKKDDAFTVINSLLAEQKISSDSQVLGLEKELDLFDPSATHPNHRVYALFNAVGQAEFNRLTIPESFHHRVSGSIRRIRLLGDPIRSCHTFLSDSDWDD